MGVGTALGAAGRVLEGARGVARVFRADASEGAALRHAARDAALAQFGAEFAGPRGRFDRAVDGLNRLPRPFLAFGTFGLFAYAMADPEGFSVRMRGLAVIPEPLWWLLGAIVGFYFGARELHHRREERVPVVVEGPVRSAWHHEDAGNAALDDWQAGRD
ncbi:holin family protein [Jannaschia sp. W003]|uniref:holin family protein n=1 Tax=Jannaschia sp. W003 TaxID=2867012 RepID=UPI0021A93F65|nr:holin family protein [Jannaschia sp. W003]UWQ21020.1 holin family protein [Jannaschia sp. W003]